MKEVDYSKVMIFIYKCNDLEKLKGILIELIDNSSVEIETSPTLQESIEN